MCTIHLFSIYLNGEEVRKSICSTKKKKKKKKKKTSHGGSHDNAFSLTSLSADLLAVLGVLFPSAPAAPRGRIVLVGHSMGGPVVTHAAAQLANTKSECGAVPGIELSGLVVIDVVEGVALAALGAMRGWIDARPAGFDSVESAVRHAVTAGLVRCPESARVAVPETLVAAGSDEPGPRFRWRTSLEDTEPHWRGWFEGLSSRFLAVSVPKVLILAGAERLDVELMRAQMEGKFQLVLLQGVGHAVQEDAPDRTAEALLTFAKRFSMLPGHEVPCSANAGGVNFPFFLAPRGPLPATMPKGHHSSTFQGPPPS
jgi:protein phosphatase methylesterase 1